MSKKLARTAILLSWSSTAFVAKLAVHDTEVAHVTTVGELLTTYRSYIPYIAISRQFAWLFPWMPVLPDGYPLEAEVDLLSDMSGSVLCVRMASRYTIFDYRTWQLCSLIAYPYAFTPRTLYCDLVQFNAYEVIDLRTMLPLSRLGWQEYERFKRRFGMWWM